MPRVSVWIVRTALVHLGIGVTLGSYLLASKGSAFDPLAYRWLPAHMETMLLGWTLQLAMGMAAWILPRFAAPPKYGRLWLAWLAYALLNGGIVLVVLSALVPQAAIWGALIGRVLEAAAVVSFVLLIWGRVKLFGQ